MAYSNLFARRGTKRAALRGALGRLRGKGTGVFGSEGRSQRPELPGLELPGLEQDALNTVIEGEAARTVVGAIGAGFADHATAPKSILASRARAFVQAPLHLEASELVAQVNSLLDEGLSLDTIYDELLAPAARRLGEMWEQDSCDFVDVTMGLWRLQEVMQEIYSKASPPAKARANLAPSTGRKALFAPMPGDQHFLGPQILADVFTRARWDTLLLTEPRRGEILAHLSKESFDLVGLTLSRDCPSAALRNLISAMRLASRNSQVSILVGGRMINQNPAVVAEVGADGTGADARAALDAAERLVESAKVRAQLLR